MSELEISFDLGISHPGYLMCKVCNFQGTLNLSHFDRVSTVVMHNSAQLTVKRHLLIDNL